MKRLVVFFLSMTTVISIVGVNLLAQEPVGERYPKVLGEFWSLPTKGGVVPGFGPGGDFGDGEGSLPEGEWTWYENRVKFLRRFDKNVVDWTHVMSWEKIYNQYSPVLTCISLNHDFFGHYYDHDSYHGASKQDLLTKSKAGPLLIGSDVSQEVYARYDTHNFNHSYFSEVNADHGKRELSDWLSPGWFEMAVGDIVNDIDYLGDDYYDITIEHAESLSHFQHACWDAPDNDRNCSRDQMDVRDYTYVMVLPIELDEITLTDCWLTRHYEIMKVTDIIEPQTLRAKRAQLGTPQIDFYPGQEIRPLIWANPIMWGSTAFFMNPSEDAPRAYLQSTDSGLYWLSNVTAAFAGNHLLKAQVAINRDFPSIDTTIYLDDGLMLDAYLGSGLKAKVNTQKVYLHAEKIDLNLDGLPDCPGGLSENCEEERMDAWRQGYVHFLTDIRESAASPAIRNNADYVYITPNGHPDASIRQLVNGRHFEDVNGGFQEATLDKVLEHCYQYENFDYRDPRKVLFFEREVDPIDPNEPNHVNLSMMRLTMALSLITTNYGNYGTVGGPIGHHYNTRTPLFNDLYDSYDVEIEDYYDEYAVDSEGHGCRNVAFPIDNELYVYQSRYYLGEPIEEAYPDIDPQDPDLPYPRWYRDHEDIIYREFDHGLVIAHLALESCPGGRDVYDVVFDGMVIQEDPREWTMLCPGGCCFMEIEGGPCPGYYNDGTNSGIHHKIGVVVDPSGTGDAIILLKEGDGFSYDPEQHIE